MSVEGRIVKPPVWERPSRRVLRRLGLEVLNDVHHNREKQFSKHDDSRRTLEPRGNTLRAGAVVCRTGHTVFLPAPALDTSRAGHLPL